MGRHFRLNTFLAILMQTVTPVILLPIYAGVLLIQKLPKLIGVLTGILFAASVYIRVAAGNGMVPDVTADYCLYLTLISMLLSWITFGPNDRYTVMSAVVGLVFCGFYFFSIFLTGFKLGLPGTDFITLREVEILLDAPIILGVILLIRRFQLFPAIVIGFIGGFVLILVGVHALTDAFVDISIQRTIKNGGYVIVCSHNGSERRRAATTADINFGLIVGHRSDRIVFVSNTAPREWRYGRFETSLANSYTCPPNGSIYRRNSSRFDE